MSLNREESIVYAEKFLEDTLSFFGINFEIKATADEDVIQLSVPSSELNSLLIGRNAETLRALQHLTATSLIVRDAELTRVNVDVANYKKQREEKLLVKAENWISRVRQTGEEFRANLNAADRRIVHRAAQDYSDIETHSEGEGRDRVLIILKK